jgi:hypothetical protein
VNSSDKTPAENHHSSVCVCSELLPELEGLKLDLVILEWKLGHKMQAIEEKLLRMNEYQTRESKNYGNSTENALTMEAIVINDSGNNAKELSECGHFNKNASTLTETINDILGGSVEALTETTNDIIGGSTEAGEKNKNAQYNDQLLDDSHTPLNDISLDKDLTRNADNIMIMSIVGIKDVSFEAGIK